MSDEQNGDSAGSLQSENSSEVAKEQAVQENQKLITHGFDANGWLLFRMHESHGYHAMVGFIMTSLVNIVTMYFSQKQQQKLIQPGTMKPGRFGKFFNRG